MNSPAGVLTISVVIPAYNQARYLAEAIDSVLAQTHPADEIIVVDDGSTDETAEIARSYGQALRLLQQQNKGLAGARNAGVRVAKGEWIGLLDADDRWRPEFIERVLMAMQREPDADFFTASLHLIDEEGCPLAARIPVQPGRWEDPYRMLLGGSIASAGASVIRRHELDKVGGFDERFRRLEDWDISLSLAREGAVFVGIPTALVEYRLHGQSLSTDREKMARSLAAVAEKHVGSLGESLDHATWSQRRAWGAVHRTVAIMSLSRFADWKGAWLALWRAMAIDPSLAGDEDLCYEFALGTQTLGLRGSAEGLRLEETARELALALAPDHGRRSPIERSVFTRAASGLWLAYANVAYRSNAISHARQSLWRALRARPGLVAQPNWVRLAARCTLLWPVVRMRRRRETALSNASAPLGPPDRVGREA